MQSPEFNKLMEGKQAQWAELFADGKPVLKHMLEDPSVPVTTKREEIAKEEVPVPPHIVSEINKFVEAQKKLGTKGRTIRRMVQRKWNIKVV